MKAGVPRKRATAFWNGRKRHPGPRAEARRLEGPSIDRRGSWRVGSAGETSEFRRIRRKGRSRGGQEQLQQTAAYNVGRYRVKVMRPHYCATAATASSVLSEKYV